MLVQKSSPVRTYELTYLVGSGYTTAETASLQDQITALIGKYNGKIVEVIDWGKKALAYPIHHEGKSHVEANYTHIVLEMPAERAQKFANDVKMKREIIRSLLVVR